MDLNVKGLQLGYGEAVVIDGLDLDVKTGELVTLLGANGAGKTTLLNGLIGLISPKLGRVLLDGTDVTRSSTTALVDQGLALVPERRELFGTLSVEVNLNLGSYRHANECLNLRSRVYELFPILRERRGQLAKTLSGGEQQMLALGRALMGKPKFLMLDEPSIGLAPKIVREIIGVLKHLNDEGMSVLLVEQNARLALEIATRGYVLELGQVVLQGSSHELLHDERLKQAYLGGAMDYSALRSNGAHFSDDASMTGEL